MSTKRHLPLLGVDAVSEGPAGSAVTQVLLSALASLLLWLPLGMVGLYLARVLRGWLPAGTSPALGLLAVAPLLLSFAVASFLAVALTMRPCRGRRAVVLPLLSATLASGLTVALAHSAGMLGGLGGLRELMLLALVLCAVAVPSALGGIRFGRRWRR